MATHRVLTAILLVLGVIFGANSDPVTRTYYHLQAKVADPASNNASKVDGLFGAFT